MIKWAITVVSLVSFFSSSLAATLRDPTRPAEFIANPQQQQVGYQLQSVLIGKTKKLALINNTFVGVGQSIGNAKVLAIGTNTVVLLEGGKKITLHVFEGNLRNPE